MEAASSHQSFLSNVWTLLDSFPAEPAPLAPQPAEPVIAQSSAPGENEFTDDPVVGPSQTAFEVFLHSMDAKLALAFTALEAKVSDAHAG
eukprot:4014432-Amphidinium_carterae.1